jgi:oxygen-independent coproporphyrinogen-3 oxidase
MHYPAADLVIDPVLIRKYDLSGPRYTSYPTADRFVEAFGEPQLRQWLARRNIGGFSQPLSLYVHLPFCSSLCYYCGCNKIVTRDRGRSAKYIKYLEKELALLAPLVGERRELLEMHWGGGTPNFLAREEMAALVHAVEARLPRAPRSQYSIEIDPRFAELGLLPFLAELGFDRVSFGVQDFDPAVQRAVHRVQSVELTQRVVEEARACGMRSVNLDLIYGLPKQTLDSFNRTLDQVLRLDPDRIALYNYAHLPRLFKPQRRIEVAELPSAEVKLELMTLAIGRLTRAGYLYIGMDHFARPDDELALAQAHGQLARSFQGYSTHPGDLLALGVSAIGQIGPSYYQNLKEMERYEEALDAGRLPVMRGVELTSDDLVRRAVIQSLMCHFRVSIESIELAHLIDFRSTVAPELADLRQLAQDGLVELVPDWIVVTPKGRLLVRAIAMLFDRYLRQARQSASYSRVI